MVGSDLHFTFKIEVKEADIPTQKIAGRLRRGGTDVKKTVADLDSHEH